MFRKNLIILFLIFNLLSFFIDSFFLCSLTNAQTQWVKYVYFQNWAGLNDQLSSTEITDNEASDIQNIVFDTGGAIKKRFGYETIPNNPIAKVTTGTSIVLTGLAFLKNNNGDKHIIAIANSDGRVQASKKTYQPGGGFALNEGWIAITGDLPASGYTDNSLVDTAIAEDKLIIAFDSVFPQKPFRWSGSGQVVSLTADTDCPNASLVEYHKNHLILAGNTTNPSRLWFSKLDDITNYTATDYIDIATSDGSQIRGLLSALDSLYIFKDNSIWRLSGYDRDSWFLEKLVSGIGTLSDGSIAIVNNNIYFTTAQNDIAVYDGGYNIRFVSQKIRNTIGGLNFSRATNTLGIGYSTYRYADNDYYSSVSNAGSAINNKVLFFDTAYGAWSKFVGINANAWCVAENALGQNILIFGDYNGYVHYYPNEDYYDGNVNTDAIIAFYQTKWFRYPEISLGDKYWRLLKTYAQTETNTSFLYADCKSDFENTGKSIVINLGSSGLALWDISYWDVDLWGGQNLTISRDEIEKGTNLFQIRYYNNDVNQGFTIFGWEVFVEPTTRI